MQPALATRPFWISAAPSCSGDWERKSLADGRVDRSADLDLIAEPGLALDYEQRTHVAPRQRLGGAHDLFEHLRFLLSRHRREEAAAHPREGAPDIVLEQDDDDQHHRL